LLISHRHKFIFFHLPKAAGSSVEAALRRFSHIPTARLYNYMIDYLGQQRRLNLYERHIRPYSLLEINPHLFHNGYLKFAVVRNTWDWHCSQFHFHRKTPGTVFHAELKDAQFSDYIDWACDEDNILRANSRQKWYLSDTQGTLLVDRVLRFESLESEFGALCSTLGISAQLGTKNRSFRTRDYRDEYSESDRRKIAASHQEDIDFFGFEF